MGPLEVLVIECPGQKVKSEIVTALASAVDSGTLRIIDVTFVHKDATGLVSGYELAEIEEYELAPYDIVDETRGLLSASDVRAIGEQITPDSSAILMVIEHAWTADLEQTVATAECRIVLRERIPTDIAVAAVDKSETLRKPLEGGGWLMFGRWLKLPRDGPDLLGALLPIVRSTSGRTTIGGVARCTPSAAPLGKKALALRARDRRRPLVPKLDRQLAIGLLSSRFSEELSL